MFTHEDKVNDRVRRKLQLGRQEATNNSRLDELEKEGEALKDELTEHPSSGSAVHQGPSHERQRRAELAREGEQAFIVISAIAGVIFTWLSTELALPWFAKVAVLAIGWAVVSYFLARAFRVGMVWTLRIRPKDRASLKRALLVGGVLFVAFVVLIIRYSIVRFTANDDDVGYLQVAIEMIGLLLAGTAGAIYVYESHLPGIVARLRRNESEHQEILAHNRHIAEEKGRIDEEIQALQRASGLSPSGATVNAVSKADHLGDPSASNGNQPSTASATVSQLN